MPVWKALGGWRRGYSSAALFHDLHIWTTTTFLFTSYPLAHLTKANVVEPKIQQIKNQCEITEVKTVNIRIIIVQS